MDMIIWLKVKGLRASFVLCVCSCLTLSSLLIWNILVVSGLTSYSNLAGTSHVDMYIVRDIQVLRKVCGAQLLKPNPVKPKPLKP